MKDEERKQVNKSLKISLLEAYPTMNVLILDENLYVYFCFYGHRCDESPALTFEGYKKNESAQYFESQLTAIERHAEKPALQRFLVFRNAPTLKKPDAPIDCKSLDQYLEK